METPVADIDAPNASLDLHGNGNWYGLGCRGHYLYELATARAFTLIGPLRCSLRPAAITA